MYLVELSTRTLSNTGRINTFEHFFNQLNHLNVLEHVNKSRISAHKIHDTTPDVISSEKVQKASWTIKKMSSTVAILQDLISLPPLGRDQITSWNQGPSQHKDFVLAIYQFLLIIKLRRYPYHGVIMNYKTFTVVNLQS